MESETAERIFRHEGREYLLPSIRGYPPALLRHIGQKHRSSVLITGPTGTGKEVLADFLCDLDPMAKKGIERTNCSGLPENLIDSELFGHTKGAFSGAEAPRVGILAAREGGVVFLDEIGRMPPSAQARLLRFMEDGKVRRVGADNAEALEDPPRIIAATNVNLDGSTNGTPHFLPDLRNRFDYEIQLPELQHRGTDIFYTLSLPSFLGRDPTVSGIHLPLLIEILSYDWPGNIRELSKYCARLLDANLIDTLTTTNRHIAGETLDTIPPGGQPFDGARISDYLALHEAELIADATSEEKKNTLRLLTSLLFTTSKWLGLTSAVREDLHPACVALADLSAMTLTPSAYRKYDTSLLKAPLTVDGNGHIYFTQPLTLTETLIDIRCFFTRTPTPERAHQVRSSRHLESLISKLGTVNYGALNLREPQPPPADRTFLATCMREKYNPHEIEVAQLLFDGLTEEQIAGKHIQGFDAKQRISEFLNARLLNDPQLTVFRSKLERRPGRRPKTTP